ncbi:MAG TPA: TIGR03617 family F420-dependent LLM class oxidoreductase [Candidatus Limnocylindrales bacterium]
MRLGLGLGGPLRGLAGLARLAEEAGFESAWLTELDHSGFVAAQTCLAATDGIVVGTAVALAFPRSPTITALTAWDLDELSGERFVLGLGPQVRRVMEARFSVPYDRPAARLAEYVRAVRTVWAANRGAAVTHEGEFYRITMPTFHGPPRPERRDVPILLAAVGPVMSRTCGEVADGLLGHPLASPRYLAEIVGPAVADGLARTGRPSGACPITAAAIVSVGDDPDAARRAARLQLAFYATTPSYRGILELHGRGALQGELRRAFVRRDADAMAALIDDELLDAIAVAGRPDEARDRLRAWDGAAERVIVGPPWYGLGEGRAREAVEAVVDCLRPSAD